MNSLRLRKQLQHFEPAELALELEIVKGFTTSQDVS